MIKSIFLTAFILSLLYATEAKLRCSTNPCQVAFFGPESPPVCETVVDENGQEQQQCYAIGSAAFAAALSRSNPSFGESIPLSQINFSGNCRCILTLWSQANFQGESFTYRTQNNNDQVFPDEIWSQENQSFRVRCRFG